MRTEVGKESKVEKGRGEGGLRGRVVEGYINKQVGANLSKGPTKEEPLDFAGQIRRFW